MRERQRENLEQTLISLEDQAWQALSQGTGADFYERNLVPQALMVFPFGILTREDSIEAMRQAPPWVTYHIENSQVIALTDASAILTYQAMAQRTGHEPYAARMTTVFVKHDGDWKTVFHQQTPPVS